MLLIVLMVFITAYLILPAIPWVILMLIDFYIYSIIDSIRDKLDNSPTMTVTYTPQYA
jgi:uncharacterized protein YqgC (DUF456 family)